MPCLAGEYYNRETNTCSTCDQDTYSVDHATQCEKCAPGTTSNSQHTKCGEKFSSLKLQNYSNVTHCNITSAMKM